MVDPSGVSLLWEFRYRSVFVLRGVWVSLFYVVA